MVIPMCRRSRAGIIPPMSSIYTKRNKPLPDKLTYSIERRVRIRIRATLYRYAKPPVTDFLDNLQQSLIQEYGRLAKRNTRIAAPPGEHHPTHATIEHLDNCPSEQVLDFIELAFRSRRATVCKEEVDEVEEILRE